MLPIVPEFDGLGASAKHQPTMLSEHRVQFVPQNEDPILTIPLEAWVMSSAVEICSWLPGRGTQQCHHGLEHPFVMS